MRKSVLLILVILAVLSTSWLNANSPALEQKGMALGLFSKDPNYSYLKDLQEMKDWGVRNVLLIVSWYQHDVKSNEMIPRSYDGNDVLTLPDPKVKEVIDQAHSLG